MAAALDRPDLPNQTKAIAAFLDCADLVERLANEARVALGEDNG